MEVGRDWTRKAEPSQLHVVVQFIRDGEGIEGARGAFAVEEGGIVPMPSDLLQIPERQEGGIIHLAHKNTLSEGQNRLFLQAHQQAGNAGPAVLAQLKPRLNIEIVKGFWKSLE